uniref:Uncharacterized protein n=1 Tax=Anguilla anguilla TaxID=7936 RepID=A0A0E9PTS4_ANGAN
MILKLLSLAN